MCVVDYSIVATCQCFPLYYYKENKNKDGELFDGEDEEYKRYDAISNYILKKCNEKYNSDITKEDIFYYVYGFLHSKDYREKFQADLKRTLPRIKFVDKIEDFWAFSKAGKELANLHLNYESVEPCEDCKVVKTVDNYIVDKMTFAKDEAGEKDKTTIIYNNFIRIENIPLKAYEYVVNGKSAVEWIMDRYKIKVDKDSGITNDPNEWVMEHGKQGYILDLLLSVVNLSIKTIDIMNNLPKLEF